MPSAPGLPTWILLIPAPASEARRWIERFLVEELDLDWTEWAAAHPFRATTDEACAVVSRAPEDAEGANALAEWISTQVKGGVYVLEFADPPYALAFESGAVRVCDEDPWVLAARHHLPIAGLPVAAVPRDGAPLRSVAVVEGIDPARAREALARSRSIPVSADLHFEAVPLGTLIWSDLQDVQFAGGDITEECPECVAYDLVYEPGRGRLTVHAFAPSGPGRFVTPQEFDAGETGLPSIKGETTIGGILQALGVTEHHLLGAD